jgi:hypothetical protein
MSTRDVTTPNHNSFSSQETGVYVMDYRCEDREKCGKLRGDIDASGRPLSNNTDHHSQKYKPFGQEMHLQIPIQAEV